MYAHTRQPLIDYMQQTSKQHGRLAGRSGRVWAGRGGSGRVGRVRAGRGRVAIAFNLKESPLGGSQGKSSIGAAAA